MAPATNFAARATCCPLARRSEPETYASEEIHPTDILARGALESSGATDAAAQFDAYIGRELPRDFITQAHAQFDIGQPRADRDRPVILRGEIHFRARLQNQLLREPLVDRSLDTGGDTALVRQEQPWMPSAA